MAKAVISFSIDADLLKQMDELADAKDISRSKFLERLVREEVQGGAQALKLLSDPKTGPAFLRLFGSPEFVQQMADALGDQLPENALPLFERKLRGAVKEVGKAAKEVRPRRGRKK